MGSSVGMHDSRAISGHASGIRNEDDKDSRDDDDDFTFEEPDSKEKERVLRLRPEIVSFASTFTSKRFRLEQWEDLADFRCPKKSRDNDSYITHPCFCIHVAAYLVTEKRTKWIYYCAA